MTRRQYPCRHVPDETVTESCRCDQYGREIERLYTVVQDGAEEGVYLQYHRETWEYGEKCECLYTDFYSPDGEGYTEHLPAHHAPSEERTHHDATCTQPAYFEWSCPVCGETAYEWDRYWYPLGHSFNGEGKCDYCGLVVPQDANGSIVLEDLSEGEDYKVGVWFRDVSPVDIMTTTRLVYLDGEGDTHEIEVTLDWATAKCPIDFECYIYSLQKALVESAKAAAESSGEYQAGWTYQGLALTFLARFGNENQVITIVLTEEGATVPDAPMQASFLQE